MSYPAARKQLYFRLRYLHHFNILAIKSGKAKHLSLVSKIIHKLFTFHGWWITRDKDKNRERDRQETRDKKQGTRDKQTECTQKKKNPTTRFKEKKKYPRTDENNTPPEKGFTPPHRVTSTYDPREYQHSAPRWFCAKARDTSHRMLRENQVQMPFRGTFEREKCNSWKLFRGGMPY